MLAIKQIVQYKRQSRTNLGFVTASNQNEIEARMTEFPYSSIIWLTQGKYTIVDNDCPLLDSNDSWHIRSSSDGYLYAIKRVKGKNLKMHRVLTNCPDNKLVDHKNHNTLDNRLANLRICSIGDNNRNRKLDKANSSGFKGITERTNMSGKFWQTMVSFNNRNIHVGVYKTPEEAARAYDIAAIKYHGEFALTNEMLGLLPTPPKQKGGM